MGIRNTILNMLLAGVVGGFTVLDIYSLEVVDLKIIDSLCWNTFGVATVLCYIVLTLKDIHKMLVKK